MRTVIQPDTLFDSTPYHFSQVITAPASGTLVFLAGQAAMDPDGRPTGGDHAAQARQALENVRLGLAAAGAQLTDIVSLRVYVVDHAPEVIDAIMPVFAEFFGEVAPPANTWIGVQALALPELKIEMEVQAVVGA